MTEKIHWLTPCSECGNQENFKVMSIKKLGFTYIADCKCPRCGTINKFRIHGTEDQLKELILKGLSDNIPYQYYRDPTFNDPIKELKRECMNSLNCR